MTQSYQLARGATTSVVPLASRPIEEQRKLRRALAEMATHPNRGVERCGLSAFDAFSGIGLTGYDYCVSFGAPNAFQRQAIVLRMLELAREFRAVNVDGEDRGPYAEETVALQVARNVQVGLSSGVLLSSGPDLVDCRANFGGLWAPLALADPYPLPDPEFTSVWRGRQRR